MEKKFCFEHQKWSYLIFLISLILSPFGLDQLYSLETEQPSSVSELEKSSSKSDLEDLHQNGQITSVDQLPSLLVLDTSSVHDVSLFFKLDTEAFRNLRVVFSQLQAPVNLDMSSCTLASNIVSIGGTFKDCVALESIILPEGLLYSGDEAFMGCTNLKSIELPQSLQIIFSSAFSDCINLQSIAIPPNVTTIGDNAFLNCSKITKIELPPRVTGIGTGAFAGCSSLQQIIITSKSQKYSFVSGILYERVQGGKALHSYIVTGSVPLIPPDVTEIFDRAFYNNSVLSSIIIPSTITSIGDEVFAYCSNLIYAEIPESVSFLGRDVFLSCPAMTEIVIRALKKAPTEWDRNWLGDQLYSIIKWKQ